MTTLDTRPAAAVTAKPQVIDGSATDRPVQSNPHRFGMYSASVVLAGAAAAMFTQLNGSHLEKGGATFALLVALTIWVRQLFRFNQRADLGDR